MSSPQGHPVPSGPPASPESSRTRLHRQPHLTLARKVLPRSIWPGPHLPAPSVMRFPRGHPVPSGLPVLPECAHIRLHRNHFACSVEVLAVQQASCTSSTHRSFVLSGMRQIGGNKPGNRGLQLGACVSPDGNTFQVRLVINGRSSPEVAEHLHAASGAQLWEPGGLQQSHQNARTDLAA